MNYYRCSFFRGCGSKKMVEESMTEPNMFIVTYIGDHHHEKPPFQHALAGTTRVKPMTRSCDIMLPNNTGSASSSSFSPLLAANPLENNNNMVAHGEPRELDQKSEMEPVFNDDDDILIPNLAAMSDICEMGYQWDPNSALGLI